MNTDFRFTNHGSIITVIPVTDTAKEFIESEVHLESWQWMGNSIALDHRCARDLADVIVEAGFSVE